MLFHLPDGLDGEPPLGRDDDALGREVVGQGLTLGGGVVFGGVDGLRLLLVLQLGQLALGLFGELRVARDSGLGQHAVVRPRRTAIM